MAGIRTKKTGIVDSREKAIACARLASNRKADDVVILDVAGLSSFTDFFVICTGTSSRQVQGIADHLEGELRARGVKPLGAEGQKEGHWVLLDYGDVVVHVFYEPLRGFYDLESLWSEAEKIGWEENPDTSKSL